MRLRIALERAFPKLRENLAAFLAIFGRTTNTAPIGLGLERRLCSAIYAYD